MRILALLVAALASSSCAYTFQNSKGSSLEKEGVQRIYVAPLRNDSYKAGVENLLYNELLQSISAGRRVRIVSKPEYADATLKGHVRTASYSASQTTNSDALFPTNSESVIKTIVATEYQAVVECEFTLTRNNVAANKPLWTSSFSKTKRFPASNQKGAFGTTSPLINESEFDRALKDMAREMMMDVHESMLAMF